MRISERESWSPSAVWSRLSRTMRFAPTRRGPVIAVVVGLVVLAAPSLAVAGVGGVDSGRASFARGGPVARPATPEPRLDAIPPPGAAPMETLEDINHRMLTSLKENALSPRHLIAGGIAQSVVTAGLGWVLSQYGLGGNDLAGIQADLAGIRTQLNEMQNTLNKIDAATTQLRAQLADSNFTNLVQQATDIVAHVDTGIKDLDAITQMSPDSPIKAGRTEHLLNLIQRDLLDNQRTLAYKISGIAGAGGLIRAAYDVALAHHRFWTLKTSLRVREIVTYFQAAETRMLLLRIEYMHARPDSFEQPKDADAAISEVEGWLHEQDRELKPDPGPDVIADTHSDLDWLGYGLSYLYSFKHAEAIAADVGTSGLFPVPRYRVGPFGLPELAGVDYFTVGTGWRLPLGSEVIKLIAGWSDPSGNWIHWLNDKAGGLLGRSAAPYGVWATATIGSIGPINEMSIDTKGTVRTFANPDLFSPATHRSPFLVRIRPHHYWYPATTG